MGRIVRCDKCGQRVEEKRETSLPSGRYCQICYDRVLDVLVQSCQSPEDALRMQTDPWSMLDELNERRRRRLQSAAAARPEP